jgi:hypothetical protein
MTCKNFPEIRGALRNTEPPGAQSYVPVLQQCSRPGLALCNNVVWYSRNSLFHFPHQVFYSTVLPATVHLVKPRLLVPKYLPWHCAALSLCIKWQRPGGVAHGCSPLLPHHPIPYVNSYVFTQGEAATVSIHAELVIETTKELNVKEV